MADIPSISSGSVGSRFVSQSDLDQAKQQRDADWKAAYARLGQEPPPRPEEDADYDGRSLYERLQSQKTAKQEEWDEKMKLSNQFRSLEEDEIVFLDAVQEDKRSKERRLKDQETEELLKFREAVAARTSAPSRPPPAAPPPPAAKAAAAATAITKRSSPPKPKGGVIKKDQRSLLKGLVIAKKKPATKSGVEKTSIKDPKISSATIAPSVIEKGKKREATGDEATELDKSKRVKTDDT